MSKTKEEIEQEAEMWISAADSVIGFVNTEGDNITDEELQKCCELIDLSTDNIIRLTNELGNVNE